MSSSTVFAIQAVLLLIAASVFVLAAIMFGVSDPLPLGWKVVLLSSFLSVVCSLALVGRDE